MLKLDRCSVILINNKKSTYHSADEPSSSASDRRAFDVLRDDLLWTTNFAFPLSFRPFDVVGCSSTDRGPGCVPEGCSPGARMKNPVCGGPGGGPKSDSTAVYKYATTNKQ